MWTSTNNSRIKIKKMGYKSDAQRKAVHASKADGGKGSPNKMKKKSPYKQKGVASKTAKKINKKPLEYSGPKGIGSKGPKKNEPMVMKEAKYVEMIDIEPKYFQKTKMSPMQMNRYDKDMMHERELIYDAKKEIHKEDMAKKKSMAKQKGYVYSEKEMKEGRKRAYLAEQAKKTAKQKKDDITEMDMDQAKIAQYKKNNPEKFKNAADSPAKMSNELKYMPIVDREKSTMSAMGSHKILKHMKGRM